MQEKIMVKEIIAKAGKFGISLREDREAQLANLQGFLWFCEINDEKKEIENYFLTPPLFMEIAYNLLKKKVMAAQFSIDYDTPEARSQFILKKNSFF